MPSKIESIILLSTKRTGAYVVLQCLENLIDKHPNFYSLTRQQKIKNDISQLLATQNTFPPEAMTFPAGKKINITRNKYLNKSPLLGLVAEYLAYGEKDYHRFLLEIYINLYFKLSERFDFSDDDYSKWLKSNQGKILGIYQSIVENSARQLRHHFACDDAKLSANLLEALEGDSLDSPTEVSRSLRRLNLYCNGLKPISRQGHAKREKHAQLTLGEEINTYAISTSELDDVDVEQKVIEQAIPKYINTIQDLLRQQNKIKGRANQLNRQMQLRALDRNFLRPSAWNRLDQLFHDEEIDIHSRALICLSLIAGRNLETCFENLKDLLKKKGHLSISLNIPTVTSNKENLPVNNTLIVPIPFRYRYLISSLHKSTPDKVVNSAKKEIKSIESEFDISPIKIARLFFFLANAQSSKTFAAIVFDNPLSTIATQLHYSLTSQQKLGKLYAEVFQEFEKVLPNPQGIEHRTYSDVSGIANFPKTDAIQTILQTDAFNRNMLRGFFLYAAVNASRGVIDQAPDSYVEVDHLSFVAIVNDKKRDGAEHARISIFQRKCLTKVFSYLGLPSLKPSKVFFPYVSKGIQHPLSPRHFSSKRLPKKLRMNSIRKIRRSVWLNLGMDEEIIDALYGHHYVGTVPISSQSSLSLLLIYQSALPYIQDFSLLIEQLINEK